MARRSYDFPGIVVLVALPIVFGKTMYESLGPFEATAWIIGVVGGFIWLGWWMSSRGRRVQHRSPVPAQTGPSADLESYARRDRIRRLSWCPQCGADALGWDHPKLDGTPDFRFKENAYRCTSCGWAGAGENDAIKQNIAKEALAAKADATPPAERARHYIEAWPEAQAYRVRPLEELHLLIGNSPSSFDRLPATTQAIIAATWQRHVADPTEIEQLPEEVARALRRRFAAYLEYLAQGGSGLAARDLDRLRQLRGR